MAILGRRYRLVERLGVGGMSIVWRAYDEVLGRQVAVKVLAGDLAARPEFRRAIRREARAAAGLSHPNIGVVYDYGEWRDEAGVTAPYVVMELIDGPCLSDRLDAGALPWRAAVGVCAQVAAALGAAHARGLVHRDVKPANILLPSTGAKVVDFGISALVGEQVDRDGDGSLQGTPGYLAPERLLGEPVGAAADIYALGAVLFKSLTGRLPWSAEDEAEILAAHLEARPEPLAPVDGMPGTVTDLYLRCLAKDPRRRPDADELAAALGGAAGLAVTPLGALGVATGGDGPGREPTALLPTPGTTRIVLAGRARVPGHAGTARSARTHQPTGLAWRVWRRAAAKPGRRGRVAGLTLLPLAVLAGALYVTTTDDGHGRTRVPAARPHGAPCEVTYRVATDDGTSFAGTLTVQAPRTPDGAAVSFDMPAGQTFRASAPATSTQSGVHVVVRIPGTGPVSVPFTGSYRGTNPMPATFVASGRSCNPMLLGPNDSPPPPTRTSTSDGDSSTTDDHLISSDGTASPAASPTPATFPTPAASPTPTASSSPARPGKKTPPGHLPGHGRGKNKNKG